jgi:hypothetical protein
MALVHDVRLSVRSLNRLAVCLSQEGFGYNSGIKEPGRWRFRVKISDSSLGCRCPILNRLIQLGHILSAFAEFC